MAGQRGEGCDWHIGRSSLVSQEPRLGVQVWSWTGGCILPLIYSLRFFLSWDIMSMMSDLPASAQPCCLTDQALRHAGTAAKVTWLG